MPKEEREEIIREGKLEMSYTDELFMSIGIDVDLKVDYSPNLTFFQDLGQEYKELM